MQKLSLKDSLDFLKMELIHKNLEVLDQLFLEIQQSYKSQDHEDFNPGLWRDHLVGQVYLASETLLEQVLVQKEVLYQTILQEQRRGGIHILLALCALLLIFTLSLKSVQKDVLIPIEKLQSAIEELSTADLKTEPLIQRKDEIGELYLSFCSMLEDVRGAVASLEQEVKLREEIAAELLFSNKELESFAHIVSHDLQEPLNTIRRLLQLLEDNNKDNLDENSKEHMALVIDAASRMRQLILDLLQLARLGKEDLQKSEVDCERVTQEVCQDLNCLIEESGTQIHIDPIPKLKASAKLLAPVFRNLITNAIKYNESPRPVVRVRCERLAQGHAISVEDNGIGMRKTDLEEIFKPFHRLHSRGAYPGTGIGLAICQKAITLHGGKIWARSIPDEGSTFIFTIPGEMEIPESGEQRNQR